MRLRATHRASHRHRPARRVRPYDEVDEDVLRLGVQVDGGHPELPPDAGHLVAAERRLGVDAEFEFTDRTPGLDALRGPEGLADVAAPDRA